MKKIILILSIILLSSCDTAKNRYYTQIIINSAISKQKTYTEKKTETIKDTIDVK